MSRTVPQYWWGCGPLDAPAEGVPQGRQEPHRRGVQLNPAQAPNPPSGDRPTRPPPKRPTRPPPKRPTGRPTGRPTRPLKAVQVGRSSRGAGSVQVPYNSTRGGRPTPRAQASNLDAPGGSVRHVVPFGSGCFLGLVEPVPGGPLGHAQLLLDPTHRRQLVLRVDAPDDLRVNEADLGLLVRTLLGGLLRHGDRKSTRLNSSHVATSYAVFCSKT